MTGSDAKAATTALTAAIRDEDSWVRLAAAVSLERIRPGSKEVVPVLVELSKEEDGEIRGAAVAALRGIDPEAAKEAGVH